MKNQNGMNVFQWVNEYDNGFGHGLSAMLVDVINENEGIEFSLYDSIKNGCIYISQTYPWHFNKKEKTLTPYSVHKILKKYLQQITKDQILCKDLALYVDDFD